MKTILHVALGIVGFILIGVAYIFSKIFGNSRSDEKEWVRNFIIFFAANKIQDEYEPKSAKDLLRRLYSGQLSFSDEQSLLVLLKAYLYKIDEPPLQPADLASVVKMIPKVLKFELAGFNTPAAVRNYLTQQSKFEGDETMAPEELVRWSQKIGQAVKVYSTG